MRGAAAVLALVWAGAAEAQAAWGSLRNEETAARGAEVCPIDGAAAENRFCFQVGCREGVPLGFGIAASGQYLSVEMAATVTVDGGPAEVLAFVLTDQADRWSDMGAPMEESHLALLERLRAGNGATLSFETLLESHEIEIPLRGSSAAIAAALAACPLPDFAAAEAESASAGAAAAE